MTSRDHPDQPGVDMPDPSSSAPQRDSAPGGDVAPDVDDWTPEDDAAAVPARARRRLVTPWTLGLCAVLLVTAGFIGGVQVQKGQADDGSAAAPGANAGAGAGNATRGGFAGRAAAGGDGAQGQNAPTFGSVASKKGATLYVEDADGTTVRVRTNAQSKVSRTTTASPGAIHPGDTVVVQGTKDAKGDIVATQITATAKGVVGIGGGPGGGRGTFRRAFGAPPAG
jgi:hypothetical protein